MTRPVMTIKQHIDDLGASLACVQIAVAQLDLAAESAITTKEGTVEVLRTLETCCQVQLQMIRDALLHAT